MHRAQPVQQHPIYAAIERWWELVFSIYLMVSLYSPALQTSVSPLKPLDSSLVAAPCRLHKRLHLAQSDKRGISVKTYTCQGEIHCCDVLGGILAHFAEPRMGFSYTTRSKLIGSGGL